MWRGPPLADLGYESFPQGEIGRLEELRSSALEDRIAADLELGRHADLVAELHELVARHPLRERLREQLMLALYRSRAPGRRARGLPGRSPGPDRRAGDRARPRAPRCYSRRSCARIPSSTGVVRPRPAPKSSRGVFVGRERELAELVGALENAAGGPRTPGPPRRRARHRQEPARRRADGAGPSEGARVIVGRCWEAGGAPAYWPWVQSLRAYVREAEPDALRAQLGAGAADLAQLLPELRELLPELPEPPALESEGARFRLFEAVELVPPERRAGPPARAHARRPPRRRRALAASAPVSRSRAGRQPSARGLCASATSTQRCRSR